LESVDDFKSRRAHHALQRDEKIDIMFKLLVKWFKHTYPDRFEELKREWLEMNGVEE